MANVEPQQVPFILVIEDHANSSSNRNVYHELVKSLKCPIISELTITQTLQKLPLPSSSSTSIRTQTSNHQLINDFAFEIVSEIALEHVNLNFNVVINLLLFNDARVEKLVELQRSGKACFVIIQDETINRQESHDGRHILKLSINKDSFDVSDVVTKVYDLLSHSVTEEVETPKKIMRQPLNDHLHELALKEPRKKGIPCKSCSKPIYEVSYECFECNEFTFHKSCAESSPNIKDCPSWFWEKNPQRYDFEKTWKCNNCEEFLEDCSDCLFQTNLNNGFLPPVLYSPEHDHFLHFIIMPFWFNYQYKCFICQKLGSLVSYKCFDCYYDVHVGCILLRKSWKDFDCYSLVSTSSLPQNDLERYDCQICHGKIDSDQPLYWLQEEDFAIHVRCMQPRASPARAARGHFCFFFGR